MKRVLIISYYWPPTGGSGVQRWVKFCKYLPELGWSPVVYTPENPEMLAIDKSLLAEVSDKTQVIKTKIFEPYKLYRKLTGVFSKKQQQGAEVNPINHQKKSFGQKLSMWVRGNLFIPDPRCFWIGKSFRFLVKELQKNPVDIIISTGPPHSMHLIAEKVSKKLNIPWVADFRDPWTEMFYFKHLNLSKFSLYLHRKLEKKVLDNATAIVAVSPLVKDDFERMTKTRIELITNGYDEDDFSLYQNTKIDSNNCTVIANSDDCPVRTDSDDNLYSNKFQFRIVHTGLFAADGNPTELWKALEEICIEDNDFAMALNIRLIGKTDQAVIDSIKLKNHLSDLGYQEHLVAIREQINASLLILPLRKEPEYKATLPGKLFEYLASKRPILGIGQKDGAMARILKETGLGVVYDWNEKDNIRNFIWDCWLAQSKVIFESDTIKNIYDNLARTDKIEKYSRKNTAVQMSQLLDELLVTK